MMPKRYQIKQVVQFPERTAVPKEQSENALFDIVQEEEYRQYSLLPSIDKKIFRLPLCTIDFFHITVIT